VERRELHRDPPRRPDRPATTVGVSLVQAAMRRRIAERAFEDYVREMSRQWAPRSADGGPGAGDTLPKV